jgi:hypothetical protein
LSGKHMNSLSNTLSAAHVLASSSAANADHVGERAVTAAVRTEAPAGWDAYEVWRRLIKDARDRRQHQD